MFKKINDYYEIDKNSNIRRIGKSKFLKQKLNIQGYLTVSFSINNRKYYHRVHRLLAKAFIPNPANKPCVNHKNGNKQDNRLCNLEWVTYSENNSHAFKVGLKYNNIESCRKNFEKALIEAHKLQTWKIAHEEAYKKTRIYRNWIHQNLAILEYGMTVSDMARKYNCHTSGFSKVATGKRQSYKGWAIIS